MPAKKAKPTLLRLPLATVLTEAPPSVEFALPGLPLGRVGSINGPGGVSKTNLALQMAVAQALNIPTANGLFEAPGAQRHVAFVTGEECALACTIRLHAILKRVLIDHSESWGDAARSDIVSELDERLRVYPCAGKDVSLIRKGNRTSRLKELEARVKGCDLVFLETVSRLHDGDENATHAMAALVTAVESVAQSAGCAIVMVHHASKFADMNGKGDSQHAARGSSALVDNCRWIANLFGMTREQAKQEGVEEGQRRQFVRFELVKANYIAPLAPCWLRRVEGGLLSHVPSAGVATSRRRFNGR